MKNLSLRYKLFVVLSVLIIFYAVWAALLVNFYLKNVLKKHFVNNGKVLVATLSSHLVDEMLINDFVEIYAFFDNTMINNSDVSYLFIEKNGNVLLHTFRDGFPKGLLNIGHKNSEVDYVLVTTDKETYYDFSAPIFGGTAGTLRLGMSGKMLEKLLSDTTLSLLCVAFAVVVVALAFSIIISKTLIKPLSMLTASAIEIADGNYSKTVQSHGDDEVGKLSRAFSKMEDAVKIREKKLKEINEELRDVNLKLHEYIEELNRTKDELVKSKQDMAVVETTRAMLHHMRQPLTILILAIDIVADEMQKGKAFNARELLKKLQAVEESGIRLADLLKKFEKLREYKTIEYSDDTKIVDIGE